MYVPGRYEKAYMDGLEDPDVQRSQKHQLAMMSGIQDELLRRLGTGESGAAWSSLKSLANDVLLSISEFRAAERDGDAETARDAAQSIVGMLESGILPVIESGVGEEAARNELMSVWERRARLIKIDAAAKRQVPVEVLQVFQSSFAALIMRHVQDAKILSTIIHELKEMSLSAPKTVKMIDIKGSER